MKKVPEALILQGFLALLFSSTVKDRIIHESGKVEKSIIKFFSKKLLRHAKKLSI